jgi:hypothetical protein
VNLVLSHIHADVEPRTLGPYVEIRLDTSSARARQTVCASLAALARAHALCESVPA